MIRRLLAAIRRQRTDIHIRDGWIIERHGHHMTICCPDCDWSFPGTVQNGISTASAAALMIPVIEARIHTHQHQEDQP